MSDRDEQNIREADVEAVARALRAARDFLNTLPLTDGASRRAIDREFIGVKLIPEGLLALDRLAALAADPDAQTEQT